MDTVKLGLYPKNIYLLYIDKQNKRKKSIAVKIYRTQFYSTKTALVNKRNHSSKNKIKNEILVTY